MVFSLTQYSLEMEMLVYGHDISWEEEISSFVAFLEGIPQYDPLQK